MAAPFAAGLVVYMRIWYAPTLDNAELVLDRILAIGSSTVVKDPGPGSPNLVAYNGAGIE